MSDQIQQVHPAMQPADLAGIAYDIVPLPSEGLFYENGVKEAKVYYLTAEDEAILTSPNILRSGNIIDILLERKVKVEGMKVEDLITGDRLALVIFLRVQFEPIYKLNLIDDTGYEFQHAFNLSELKMKKTKVKPDSNGHFEYELPKSKKIVKFKLLTGRDEKEIKDQNDKYVKMTGAKEGKTILYTLQRQIVAVDDNADPNYIYDFIASMPLMDSRILSKYIDSVTPTIDTNLVIPSPNGGTFRGGLPFTREFFYPAIEL